MVSSHHLEELLEKDISVSIQERNIQILVTEMDKVKKVRSPLEKMKSFKRRNCDPYNLRYYPEFL